MLIGEASAAGHSSGAASFIQLKENFLSEKYNCVNDRDHILARFDAAGRYRDEARFSAVRSKSSLAVVARSFGMSRATLETALRLQNVFTREQMMTLVNPPSGTGLDWDEMIEITSFEKWDDVHNLAQEMVRKRWGKRRFVDEVLRLANSPSASPAGASSPVISR